MTTPEQDNTPQPHTTQSTQNGGMNLNAGRDVDVEVGRDMIAGNQYTIIIHQAPPQTLTPAQRQTQTIRTNLIHNVHNTWIKGVLHASLHTAVMLELDKSYQQEAVNRTWTLYDQQKEAPVPPDKPLTTLFDEAQRKLLILGEPGSGKTITLLQLAEELLHEAADTPNAPIPVVLNLSSWGTNSGPLLPWLIDELNLQTGLARAITEQWLKIGQLILLLDGLDEVAAEQREDCVTAVNDFMKEFQAEVVVCSRSKDYDTLPSKLNLQNAIKINPLGRAKIDAYLANPDLELTAVRDIIPTDPVLFELAQTPLMLSIITLAYRGLTAAQLGSHLSVKERQTQLYTTYVQAMFGRRPLPTNTPYDQTQAQNWLTELAHGMVSHNLQIFYIEQLQPTWLPNTKKNRYRWLMVLIYGAIFGLLFGLIAGVMIELSWGLWIQFPNGSLYTFQDGLRFGLGTGLIIGVLSGLGSWFTIEMKINLLESLTWTPLTIKKIGRALRTALIFGLPIGIIIAFFRHPLVALGIGALIAIYAGVIGEKLLRELNAVLPFSIDTKKFPGIFDLVIAPSSPPASSHPNQGVSVTFRNARTFGVAVGLIAGPLMGLAIALILDALGPELLSTLVRGALGGLFFGPVIGFIYYGGFVIIQHYVLRWLLAHHNTTLPPLGPSLRNPDQNLVTFLDTMRDRILLRRVGGGWIFIHRTLLEHFAAQHPEAQKSMKDEV